MQCSPSRAKMHRHFGNLNTSSPDVQQPLKPCGAAGKVAAVAVVFTVLLLHVLILGHSGLTSTATSDRFQVRVLVTVVPVTKQN